MESKLEQSDIEETKKELALKARQKNTLRRIQTLLDVIYGLMIVKIFSLLPIPTQEQLDNRDFAGIFEHAGSTAVVMLIGIVLIIIYWGQSNRQFGNLSRINGLSATIAIVQVFALLIYLYFTKLDNQTDGDELTLLFESIFLAIAGFLGVYNWRYCRKQGFFDEHLSSEESYETLYKFYPEPIVATITIPLAFAGTMWYTIGWLLLIPVTMLMNRQKKKVIGKINAT